MTGCNSSNDEIVKKYYISKWSISTCKGYGGLNERYVMNIENKQIINGVHNFWIEMKKQKESGEIRQYDILITYESGDTNVYIYT